MALTDSKVRAAKPRAKRYRMADGGGLVLDVTPAGSKAWRYRFRRDGRDAVVTLGEYPGLSLLEARRQALDLRQGHKGGTSPDVALGRARAAAGGQTFAEVAEAYMERQEARWSATHGERFRMRIERDVNPVIGGMRPAEIQPVDVIRAVQPILDRGATNTARRVVGRIGQVLRYAVAKGLAEQDVTQHLRGGLDLPPRVEHMPAILDRARLGQVLRDIWGAPDLGYGKPMLQLTALTFQRPGEVAAMRWADVDLEDRLWAYTVTKVDVAHAVPLADEAVAILRQLQQLTGRGGFVFAGRGASGHAQTRVASDLLRRLGYEGQQTGHGFRAVARTILAEDLGIEPEIIERQLSHTVADALGRAYNRTIFLPERRDMMDRYASHLRDLRA